MKTKTFLPTTSQSLPDKMPEFTDPDMRSMPSMLSDSLTVEQTAQLLQQTTKNMLRNPEVTGSPALPYVARYISHLFDSLQIVEDNKYLPVQGGIATFGPVGSKPTYPGVTRVDLGKLFYLSQGELERRHGNIFENPGVMKAEAVVKQHAARVHADTTAKRQSERQR